jgi:hypothetical protein
MYFAKGDSVTEAIEYLNKQELEPISQADRMGHEV